MGRVHLTKIISDVDTPGDTMVTLQHPQFGEVEAVDLDFEAPEEDWRHYELEDGTELKVKTVVNKIYRFENVYNDVGNPIYEISTQNIVRATGVAEDLREEPPMPTSDSESEPEDGEE